MILIIELPDHLEAALNDHANAQADAGIALSPISLAEVVYLVGKNRINASAYHDLQAALACPEFREAI
jgi:hypothetical protein